ncbi:MAG: rod shape-determining protein MreC [Rhodospirillaceae bacterium]|nr:rod shape-determining protein MreC [Rhodospirillaceae bacterium]
MRAVAQRFSFALLVLASIAIMMLGKVDEVLLDGVRSQVSDAVAPILEAFSRPAATVAEVVEEARELTALREENALLRMRIDELQNYQAVSHRLEAENRSLQALLNYEPQMAHAFITARVIADNSGAFVRSLGVNVGTRQGVADGMAVLGGRGLVGRTVQTGERSTRVLLVTDLNARIPVIVERTRQRAMLGGDNTEQPRLLYLPPESDLRIGDRIVTSGHGGMIPPGLPIGVVSRLVDGAGRVEPFEDLSRLEYVRLVDFTPHTSGAMIRAVPGAGP